VRVAFPQAYAEAVDLLTGLRRMAEFARRRPVPPPTGCPAPLEVADQLPPSWVRHLADRADR
jgi:hypothetical protein